MQLMSREGLKAAEQKMRDAGQPEEAIRSFRSAYERVAEGEPAVIRSADLEPAGDVPTLGQLEAHPDDTALGGFAVIKLNGGLATSMGLQRPKSLVAAKDGHSFLEIIIATVFNGLGLMGVSDAVQFIATAIVLIAAVTLDSLVRRRATAGA